MQFSYDNMPDTDEARGIYDKMLRASALLFLAWRAATPTRAGKPLATALEGYSMTRGYLTVSPHSAGRWKRAILAKAREISGHE